MRAAGSRGSAGAAAWVELAETDDKLRAAFRAVFGQLLPKPQKLGLWLNARLGAKAGELTLHGRHSSHAKAWVYSVRSSADAAADAAARARQWAERQAQIEPPTAKQLER